MTNHLASSHGVGEQKSPESGVPVIPALGDLCIRFTRGKVSHNFGAHNEEACFVQCAGRLWGSDSPAAKVRLLVDFQFCSVEECELCCQEAATVSSSVKVGTCESSCDRSGSVENDLVECGDLFDTGSDSLKSCDIGRDLRFSGISSLILDDTFLRCTVSSDVEQVAVLNAVDIEEITPVISDNACFDCCTTLNELRDLDFPDDFRRASCQDSCEELGQPESCFDVDKHSTHRRRLGCLLAADFLGTAFVNLDFATFECLDDGVLVDSPITAFPTSSPIQPTLQPSNSPTLSPTKYPTVASLEPSIAPSPTPTISTPLPSKAPTSRPTRQPTRANPTPTILPTWSPSKAPTDFIESPSRSPTKRPTTGTPNPTILPTTSPSKAPTDFTESPSRSPTRVEENATNDDDDDEVIRAAWFVILLVLVCLICFLACCNLLALRRIETKRVASVMLERPFNKHPPPEVNFVMKLVPQTPVPADTPPGEYSPLPFPHKSSPSSKSTKISFLAGATPDAAKPWSDDRELSHPDDDSFF